MSYPRKISDECLKDFLDEGFNQSEIARTCSISRQAVFIRIHFKPKKPMIKLRRWTVLFLRRLGFMHTEIAEFTGYAHGTVGKLLIEKNGSSRTPVYWGKLK
jgi:hypothetical protein